MRGSERKREIDKETEEREAGMRENEKEGASRRGGLDHFDEAADTHRERSRLSVTAPSL